MYSFLLFFGPIVATHLTVSKKEKDSITIPSRRHSNGGTAYLDSAKHCYELCDIHSCDIWLLDTVNRECYVMEELHGQYKQVLQNVLDIYKKSYVDRETAESKRWMVGSFDRSRHWWENIHYFDNAASWKQLLMSIKKHAKSKYHKDQMKLNAVSSSIKSEPSRLSKTKSTVLTSSSESCEQHCAITDGCKWFYFCRARANEHKGHCYMFGTVPYRHSGFPRCNKSHPRRGDLTCAECHMDSVY